MILNIFLNFSREFKQRILIRDNISSIENAKPSDNANLIEFFKDQIRNTSGLNDELIDNGETFLIHYDQDMISIMKSNYVFHSFVEKIHQNIRLADLTHLFQYICNKFPVNNDEAQFYSQKLAGEQFTLKKT
jgi:hypothetical protein